MKLAPLSGVARAPQWCGSRLSVVWLAPVSGAARAVACNNNISVNMHCTYRVRTCVELYV
jgi:hypothetical protein